MLTCTLVELWTYNKATRRSVLSCLRPLRRADRGALGGRSLSRSHPASSTLCQTGFLLRGESLSRDSPLPSPHAAGACAADVR